MAKVLPWLTQPCSLSLRSNHCKCRIGDPELLVGHLQIGAQVIRNPRNKWFAPKYMIETDEYPDYVQGPGYLMSIKLARVCMYVCPM